MASFPSFIDIRKRVDDDSAVWQKNWKLLPETFSLPDEILDQVKLVGDMEEVSEDRINFFNID